jgi:tetratricopeptide (TPR) repeat protein
VSEVGTTLNNLANCLWEVGRLDDSTIRYEEARELCERYGFTAGISWLDAERVYDCDRHGDLGGVIAAAEHFLGRRDAATSYQNRPVLVGRARALLARGQRDEALADAERALASFRESGYDAQVANEILTATSRCVRAVGRHEEADALLAEALSVPDRVVYDLPLSLVELGRGDDYLALTGKPGYAWGEAGDAAAAGELREASEIYGSIGARFAEGWAALLAAERGDASRLDAALAYFEEQQATPYVQRCRALLQASA